MKNGNPIIPIPWIVALWIGAYILAKYFDGYYDSFSGGG